MQYLTTSIHDFIHHARQRGMDHATIRVLLLSAGWREKDISRGLAEEGLDMPVPEPPGEGGAREAFQYLLALTALTFVVVNAITIAFRFISWMLPDDSESYESYMFDYQQTQVRWSMAMLLVAFPLLLAFTYWIGSGLSKAPERTKSAIRRWLTYLALFAAAITIIGDTVSLVYGLLQGDLTTRFLLQVLVVLVVSLVVFCYYLLSLGISERNAAADLRRLDRTLAGISTLLFALTIGAGFVLAGSPFQARLKRFDDRRIHDLQQIEQAIRRLVVEIEDGKRHLKRPLPSDLSEVAIFVADEEYRARLNLQDPQTGKPYTYTATGEATFELCAEFALESRQQQPDWTHPAGRHCFSRDMLEGTKRTGSETRRMFNNAIVPTVVQ